MADISGRADKPGKVLRIDSDISSLGMPAAQHYDPAQAAAGDDSGGSVSVIGSSLLFARSPSHNESRLHSVAHGSQYHQSFSPQQLGRRVHSSSNSASLCASPSGSSRPLQKSPSLHHRPLQLGSTDGDCPSPVLSGRPLTPSPTPTPHSRGYPSSQPHPFRGGGAAVQHPTVIHESEVEMADRLSDRGSCSSQQHSFHQQPTLTRLPPLPAEEDDTQQRQQLEGELHKVHGQSHSYDATGSLDSEKTPQAPAIAGAAARPRTIPSRESAKIRQALRELSKDLRRQEQFGYLYRQLRGEMYWFRLLFLLTSFGFACSSVLPGSQVLQLLLTGLFFALDTLVVSVGAPFEQPYRNVLSALTSFVGVVQCEVMLTLVQMGVRQAADSSRSSVDLGYSQQGVSQSGDPSNELTGQSDFAAWCAMYLALAIGADVVIVAVVHRKAVLAAATRAAAAIQHWAGRLGLVLRITTGDSANETAIEQIDPRVVRRESLVDVIKSRILMVRARRQSQQQLPAEAALMSTLRPNRVLRSRSEVPPSTQLDLCDLLPTHNTATTDSAAQQTAAQPLSPASTSSGSQQRALRPSRGDVEGEAATMEGIDAAEVPVAVSPSWSPESHKREVAVDEEKQAEADTEAETDTAIKASRAPPTLPARSLPPLRIHARLTYTPISSVVSPSSAATARSSTPRSPHGHGGAGAIRRPVAQLSSRRHLSDSQGVLVSVPANASRMSQHAGPAAQRPTQADKQEGASWKGPESG